MQNIFIEECNSEVSTSFWDYNLGFHMYTELLKMLNIPKMTIQSQWLYTCIMRKTTNISVSYRQDSHRSPQVSMCGQ